MNVNLNCPFDGKQVLFEILFALLTEHYPNFRYLKMIQSLSNQRNFAIDTRTQVTNLTVLKPGVRI